MCLNFVFEDILKRLKDLFGMSRMHIAWLGFVLHFQFTLFGFMGC